MFLVVCVLIWFYWVHQCINAGESGQMVWNRSKDGNLLYMLEQLSLNMWYVYNTHLSITYLQYCPNMFPCQFTPLHHSASQSHDITGVNHMPIWMSKQFSSTILLHDSQYDPNHCKPSQIYLLFWRLFWFLLRWCSFCHRSYWQIRLLTKDI